MKKFLLIITMLFSVSSLSAMNETHIAPNFEAVTLTGKKVSLEQFKGKKVVWLTFWATWCPYCAKEIPALKNLHKKFADKVEILAINIDVRDSIEKAKDYAFEHDLPYDIIFSNEITRLYGVRGTPTQVVIDINGNIAYIVTKVPQDITEKDIDKLLIK